MTIEALIGTDAQLTWAQECARAFVIFVYGLVLVRIAGRRVFGKWSALDIIVSIIIGSNLSRALTGSAPVIGTLIATTLLMAMHWILANLAARSQGFSALVEGRPIRLATDGQQNRSAFIRHSISKPDLDEALRQSSVEQPNETRLIMLEPSGKITVLKAG